MRVAPFFMLRINGFTRRLTNARIYLDVLLGRGGVHTSNRTGS